MAEIKRFFGLHHLRTEPSMFVIRHKRGRIVGKGRGLTFWFWPLSASVALIPMDDRELVFHFHGRTADFQDVSVSGVVTFRVVDPLTLSGRIDFAINIKTGQHLKAPLEKLAQQATQLAQQLASDYVAQHPLEAILAEGVEQVREHISLGLLGDTTLTQLGLEMVSVRVNAVQPTPELERALQLPSMEEIQERADGATFRRRALAVENERAIQENEQATKLELARRQEQLIEQEGLNSRRLAMEDVEASRIRIEAAAERRKMDARADAEAIRVVEAAKVEAESQQMDIYEGLPPHVMMGLAARELAGKLQRIDHLNVSPELMGPMLASLLQAGTDYLSDPEDS